MMVVEQSQCAELVSSWQNQTNPTRFCCLSSTFSVNSGFDPGVWHQ